MTAELGLAQVNLTVPDVNAAAGSKVIVPVTISDGQDVTAIQFVLSFDSNILSLPAENVVLV